MTETVRPPAFGGARRVVVKIGSAVLSDGGAFDRVTFVSLVRDLVRLRQQGVELVVVSSGAVALGMERMGLTSRPKELPALQATAAIGQGRLMRLWEDELGHYGLRAAQVLLTHDDLRSRSRFLAARQTLRTVLELGAVPVVNENDTVAVEEIKMGDNDLLSGQMVSLVGAECLVIVSDVEGLYDRNPALPGAQRVERVAQIDAQTEASAGGSGSVVGSGGMRTKLAAVKTGGILPADGDPVAGDPVSPALPNPTRSKSSAISAAPVPSLPTPPTSLAIPSAPVPVSVAVVDPISLSPRASEATSGDRAGGVAQSSIQYSSEKIRIVTRVGKVVRSLEPQSPSYYQLRSPQAGEGMLGFLVSQDPKTPIAGFRGKTVQVVAEEYVDPRNRTQVLLRVQSIEEVLAR